MHIAEDCNAYLIFREVTHIVQVPVPHRPADEARIGRCRQLS